MIQTANLSLGEYLTQFEIARRKAEARLPNGGGFPEAFLSVLRIHKAGLAMNQKFMVLTSTCVDTDLDVEMRHMRRILGPRGMTAKQDAAFLNNASPNRLKPRLDQAGSETQAKAQPEHDVQSAKKEKRGKNGGAES